MYPLPDDMNTPTFQWQASGGAALTRSASAGLIGMAGGLGKRKKKRRRMVAPPPPPPMMRRYRRVAARRVDTVSTAPSPMGTPMLPAAPFGGDTDIVPAPMDDPTLDAPPVDDSDAMMMEEAADAAAMEGMRGLYGYAGPVGGLGKFKLKGLTNILKAGAGAALNTYAPGAGTALFSKKGKKGKGGGGPAPQGFVADSGPAPATSSPPWLMPALIGGAVLLFMRKK
jgi:hypothetical protein